MAADALTMKVREAAASSTPWCCWRPVSTATGEVLGMRVATSETGPAWNEFFADLVARGLAVRLVTSDVHTGLREAIAANLPGAGWRRCRTYHAANLMSATPKSMWSAVSAMLHSVYEQSVRSGGPGGGPLPKGWVGGRRDGIGHAAAHHHAPGRV